MCIRATFNQNEDLNYLKYYFCVNSASPLPIIEYGADGCSP